MVLSLPADEPEEPEDDEDGGHEATAAGADLVDPRLQLLGKLVVIVAHGYFLIGAELLCKGAKVNTNVGTLSATGSDPIAEVYMYRVRRIAAAAGA